MTRRPDGCVRPSLRHRLGTALVALGVCLAASWSTAAVAVAIYTAPTFAPAIAATAYPREAARLRDPTWLAQIYPPSGGGPVWFAPEGPRPAASTALRALRSAADRGLRPADYDAEALDRAFRHAASSVADTDALARADVALTAAVLRFLSDLRFGRVRPQVVEPHYRATARDAWFVAGLREAAAQDRLDALIDAAEPAFPVYARLKVLLPRYRSLAAAPTPTLPALSGARAKVVAGDPYAGAPALHELLVRLGDLPPDTPHPVDGRYSDALAAGVTRFQARHGLAQDGMLGRQTIAALNEPLATRVTQIELALERMRWLPEFAAGPAIAINVPSFQLWAFADARDTASATLTMPVIVGKAVQHETPIFIGEMRAVEFSPYWNVPRNILRNETLPRLARDPGYLGREDMELVSTRGDGRVLTSIDADEPRGTARGRVAGAAAARREERARRRQVRAAEHDGNLPARHTGARTLRAHAARLQPRLHPSSGPRDARRVRAAGQARVDGRGDRRGDDIRQEPHRGARGAHPGGGVLHDRHRRRRRPGDVPARRLRARPQAARRAG